MIQRNALKSCGRSNQTKMNLLNFGSLRYSVKMELQDGAEITRSKGIPILCSPTRELLYLLMDAFGMGMTAVIPVLRQIRNIGRRNEREICGMTGK